MTFEEWVAGKREELKRLRVDARHVTPTIRDFTQAVLTQRRGLSVIVEIAHATFEEGPLAPSPDVSALGVACDGVDVAAVAVATDAVVCGGAPTELAIAAKATSSPVLQHDLILSREQLYQARQFQADATLLTASVLQPGELKLFIDLAAAMHVATPVEVRSADELAVATAAGARLLVIPAFEGLALADALLPKVPRTAAAIVRGPLTDLAPLKGRADSVWLCGPFMKASDPGAWLKSILEAAEE